MTLAWPSRRDSLRHHVYIENNTPAWVEVSERVFFPLGPIAWDARRSAAPLTSADLEVKNEDAWWLTAPDVSSGEFEGAWEGRRVKITRESNAAAEDVLGVFRVADEYGFKAKPDKTGTLLLEPLTAALERGDAADISHGRGWFQQIGAVEAVRRLAGESSLTFPESGIPYEESQRGLSSIGRAGSFQSDGFHEIREPTLGSVFNEVNGKHCFWTETKLYEFDPDTMEFEEVSIPFIGAIGRIWRVWWRRRAADAGEYIFCASRDLDGERLYSPRGQTARAPAKVYFYNTSQFIYSITTGVALAPAMYRDAVENSNGVVSTAFFDDADKMVVGNEYYAYSSPGADKSGRFRENLCIPFDQYPFPLWSRDTDTAGEGENLVNVDWMRVKNDSTGGYSALYSTYYDTANSGSGDPRDRSYRIEAEDGVPTGEEFRGNETRAGRGYYGCVMETSDNTDWPTDGISYYPGLRHCWGQGPMLDVSFEHTGEETGYHYDSMWIAHWEWSSNQWVLKVTFIESTGVKYTTTVTTLPAHRIPTFVVCDITRPVDSTAHKGAVFYGWIDYYNSNDADDIVSQGGGLVHYTARSGVDCYIVATAPGNGAVTFDANYSGTVLTMGEKNDLAAPSTAGRWYGDNSLIAGSTHASGRWTPISMGFHRKKNYAGATNWVMDYHIALVCMDRMEMGPSSSRPVDYDSRSGVSPYRILYLNVDIDSNASAITGCDALGVTDTYGPGYDIQAKFALPPMGFNRICEDDDTNNVADALYFVSPGDNALYKCGPSGGNWDVDKCRPRWVAKIPHADQWMGPALLSVGNQDGDITKPRICGVSHPAFPTSQSELWPDGEYYGWYYGDKHSGRIGLLDLEDAKSRLEAIERVCEVGDFKFWYNRSGDPELIAYPTSATAGVALTPEDYTDAARSRLPIYNWASRSVNDIVPGDIKINVRLTTKSRGAYAPGFTGLGVWPVDIALKCISSGITSNASSDDLNIGAVMWGWRKSGKRIQTTLSAAEANGQTVLSLSDLSDIEVGDKLTFNADDAELVISAVDHSGGTVTVATAISATDGYAAGEELWVDKQSDGQWSHQTYWDGTQMRGVAEVAAAASSGDRQMEVLSLDAFAPNTIFQVHDKDGADTGGYASAAYRVKRTRTALETGGNPEIEIVRVDADEGLTQAVSDGDPISVWLNIPPTARSVRVGQTGILFSLSGAAGSAADDTEQPITEGDMIELSYPGLISKKNQHSKVTASDADSISAMKKKKARLNFNKFMDSQLASLDVRRVVRRGAEKRIGLDVSGVPVAKLLATKPQDVVSITDYDLLRDKGSYLVNTVATKASYDPAHDSIAYGGEEVSASSIGRESSFNPLNLPGLQAWYAARKETAYSDTDAVPVIYDYSGNDYHQAQATGSNQAVFTEDVKNGQPSFYFDDTDTDFYSAGDIEVHDNADGLYVAVVGRRDALESRHVDMINKYSTWAGGQRQWFVRNGLGTVQDAAAYDANTTVTWDGGSSYDDVWMIIELIWQPGDKPDAYVNGVRKGPAATAVADIDDTAGNFRIGGEDGDGLTYNFVGDWCEAIVCANSLTAQLRLDVRNYLSGIYNISV